MCTISLPFYYYINNIMLSITADTNSNNYSNKGSGNLSLPQMMMNKWYFIPEN